MRRHLLLIVAAFLIVDADGDEAEKLQRTWAVET
jgi:hypothetical protein